MFGHKKINSKNWQTFKSFTGEPYYLSFYKGKSIPSKHSRQGWGYNHNRFIYLAYWIDNYKRLNALYNKVNIKLDKIATKRSKAYDNLFSELKKYKKNNAVIFYIDGYLHHLTYDKYISWHTTELNHQLECYTLFSSNENLTYIQGDTKELEELYRTFIDYDKQYTRFCTTYGVVKNYYSVVLENIVKHKVFSMEAFHNDLEYEFFLKLKIDSNDFFAKITKQLHGYVKIEIDFCKNNFELIL